MQLTILEIITLIISVIGAFITCCTFYHKMFIAPLIRQLDRNTRDIRDVQIDHAAFSENVKHLANAIEKLTERIDVPKGNT